MNELPSFDLLNVLTPSTVFPHYDDLMKRTVEEIMVEKVRMDTRDKSFPVVDGKNRLFGIISRRDIVFKG